MTESESLPVLLEDASNDSPVRLNRANDLIFYAALAGGFPQIDLVETRRSKRSHIHGGEDAWSLSVLSLHLREACQNRTIKMQGPRLSAWVRRHTEAARHRFASGPPLAPEVSKRAA